MMHHLLYGYWNNDITIPEITPDVKKNIYKPVNVKYDVTIDFIRKVIHYG